MQTTHLNGEQIEYLLALLNDRARRLRDEHSAILKSKHMGMTHVRGIISLMEMNNQTISDLERMKKEV